MVSEMMISSWVLAPFCEHSWLLGDWPSGHGSSTFKKTLVSKLVAAKANLILKDNYSDFRSWKPDLTAMERRSMLQMEEPVLTTNRRIKNDVCFSQPRQSCVLEESRYQLKWHWQLIIEKSLLRSYPLYSNEDVNEMNTRHWSENWVARRDMKPYPPRKLSERRLSLNGGF